MNNVKQKIKKALRAYDSTIQFSESSALTDLVINPLTAVLDPFQDELATATKEQSLKTPENISEAEMDRYAANYFITRTTGNKATGNVKIFFRSPRTLYIPPGAYFETADGKKFNITSAFSVTEGQMVTNVSEYPYFDTGNIAVTADVSGVDGETGANTIKSVFGLNTTTAYIKNQVAITGGIAKETNAQLKTKILTSGINTSISSKTGIETLLLNQYSSLTSVVSIGVGDAQMDRDLIYTTASGEVLATLPSNFFRSDYLGALSGIQTPPANRSRGYWGLFNVVLPVGDVFEADDVPNPGNFTDEWTETQYINLYKIDDGFNQNISSLTLLDEQFTGGTPDNPEWRKFDGGVRDGGLSNANQIKILEGLVRLGYFDLGGTPIQLSGADIEALEGYFAFWKNKGEIGQVDEPEGGIT